MTTNPPHDDGDESAASDLLLGARSIERFLASLGMPDPNAYYLRRSGKWPIGKDGALLIASKRRLVRHAEKITKNTAA